MRMSSQISLPNERSRIVLDASVLINLNASGFGNEILSALPHECLAPTQVIDELSRGAILGHSDSQKVEHLIESGALKARAIRTHGGEIFESLVAGDALTTLDDGEAATIALAVETGGIATIDEKKALNICERRFPKLSVATTPDLLLDSSIERSIGRENLAEATFCALSVGRMRVPIRLHEAIVDLIGIERAAKCASLPKRIRNLKDM